MNIQQNMQLGSQDCPLVNEASNAISGDMKSASKSGAVLGLCAVAGVGGGSKASFSNMSSAGATVVASKNAASRTSESLNCLPPWPCIFYYGGLDAYEKHQAGKEAKDKDLNENSLVDDNVAGGQAEGGQQSFQLG